MLKVFPVSVSLLQFLSKCLLQFCIKLLRSLRCYMLVVYARFFLCLFKATSYKVVMYFLLNVRALEENMPFSAVVVDLSNADKLISFSGFREETV